MIPVFLVTVAAFHIPVPSVPVVHYRFFGYVEAVFLELPDYPVYAAVRHRADKPKVNIKLVVAENPFPPFLGQDGIESNKPFRAFLCRF